MATTDQQNALKDAMARAKQIAAKLQQQHGVGGGGSNNSDADDNRKRSAFDVTQSSLEPEKKRNVLDMTSDPKLLAQQVAKNLMQKVHTGPMLVEEVMIPNKLVGLVIGKGGEMINKLQSESGAKVQVAPDPPPGMAFDERQVTITGNAEAVAKARALISEIQNQGKVPERLMAGTLPGDFSVEMSISKGKVGLIIGKGGETIKSLQERAGCKMVLLQTGEYASTPDKPLRLSGEQSAVMYGKQLVLDLLTSKELEGMNPNKNLPEGQARTEIHVPREVVGLVIGSKGANIQQIQNETGVRIRFNNEMEGPTKTATISGDQQQVAIAEGKLNELISTNWASRVGGPRPNFGGHHQGGPPGQYNNMEGPRPGWGPPQHGPPGGPQGYGGGPPGRGPMGGNSHLPPGHKHMIINVPANKCGLVIGKGGESIKFIKSETSVELELDRSVPDTSNFKVFQIKGSDEQIEKAISIIHEKTNDSSIMARPIDENNQQGQQEQNQWGPPSSNWGPPQQNQPWNQPPQQWPGQQQQPPQQYQQQQQPQQPQQPPWSQEQGHPSQPWGQPTQPGWNQPQPTPQQGWDPNQQQQQQWPGNPQQQQQQQQPGQWPAQQPWGQQPDQQQQQYQQQAMNPNQQPNGQAAQPVASSAAAAAQVDPSQPAATAAPASGQPDYSAAWALYYQQQQYYQQYASMQQQQQAAVSSAVSSAASSQPSATTSTDASQAQAMADYQAKLAEYYKSLGQQPPQQ